MGSSAHPRSDSHPREPRSTTGVLVLLGPGVGGYTQSPHPHPVLQVTDLQADDTHLWVASPRFSVEKLHRESQSDSEHSLI